MIIEVVLYSLRHDQIIVHNPWVASAGPKGCSIETSNEMHLIIIEAHMNKKGFVYLDDFIFLGCEVYEAETI